MCKAGAWRQRCSGEQLGPGLRILHKFSHGVWILGLRQCYLDLTEQGGIS